MGVDGAVVPQLEGGPRCIAVGDRVERTVHVVRRFEHGFSMRIPGLKSFLSGVCPENVVQFSTRGLNLLVVPFGKLEVWT